MRLDILEKIHQGHLGMVKCRSWSRAAVWWLLLSLEVEEMVKKLFSLVKDSHSSSGGVVTNPADTPRPYVVKCHKEY